MTSIFRRLRRDERGATAIEYGLIAALIVIAIMGAMGAFATETITMWNRVDAEMQNATTTA